MNILYHLPTLPPQLPQAEAIAQEINALRQSFGGELIFVNPNQTSPVYIPRPGFGFQLLPKLRQLEKTLHFHHFFNPDPFPFWYLRFLKKPVVYTISCGVRETRPNIGFLAKLKAVVASDKRSYERLKAWGLPNLHLAVPGIDTARFTYSPLPLKDEIHLLIASAPWTKAQFESKGIIALLDAAQQNPHLRLTFLWRGVLLAEMKAQIARRNLETQVTVLDKLLDVNKILAKVHATVNLASDSAVIKSYPHSLIESVAAGKPVIVSRAIPMADYVEQTACGEVVESVSPEAILQATERLRQNYSIRQKVALAVGQKDFSLGGMIESYRNVYEEVID